MLIIFSVTSYMVLNNLQPTSNWNAQVRDLILIKWFSVSLMTPYLELKLCDVPLCKVHLWAVQLSTFLYDFFCHILSKIKENSTLNERRQSKLSVLGNINERLQFI